LRPRNARRYDRGVRCRTIAAFLVVLSSATAYADRGVHIVRTGDSLGSLALRYGVSQAELRAWNDLDDDTIRVGQELAVAERGAIQYRTVPGDTISCIAQRFGVSGERLRADNPRLARRGLEVGMTLRIPGGRDSREAGPAGTVHRVARGENLARIARRYGVTAAAIAGWNPGLVAGRLRVGQELAIGGTARSESVGAAMCGHIRASQALGPHAAYVLRDRTRAHGTLRTIERLRAGFDAVRAAHPRAPRVRVHDLSLPGGGPIDDHRSHQSGRDVDITYYQRTGCGSLGCPLREVAPSELDARRQWALLSHWLRRGEIEAIYVDYSLAEPLYREAQRRGATPAQLERWFQYPHGRTSERGLIRHFPNHANHVHVRFACHPSERDCR
jgi:LysM repeat protein